MTAIEQAVKNACEDGGYELPLPDLITAHTDSFRLFLDPLFWQALGKSRGWRYANEGEPDVPPAWEDQWVRFIRHLAEGKDAESFFAVL